jgi:hypothetical protein
VVHKSNGRRGAPRGNGNAKKGIQLPDWLKLETSDEILTFIRTILIPYTLSGQIGSRQAGAVNNSVKVLLEFGRLEDLERRVLELEKVKQN